MSGPVTPLFGALSVTVTLSQIEFMDVVIVTLFSAVAGTNGLPMVHANSGMQVTVGEFFCLT